MSNLIKEFKEFAVRGNMMDMAIGIIIGASFTTVVDVLVKKVILPPIALLSNGINLEHKRIILKDQVLDGSGIILTDEVAIGYGAFTEALLDFVIVAITIFIVIKSMNRLRRKAHDTKDETVVTPKEIELLGKLNDLMEEQNKLLKAQAKT